MNIDIIEFSNEEVVSYMTTLMSYSYLPYITIPSRITHHSMTCIDHIFINLSRKEKVLNILNGLFYCEISDHLLCFISIKINRICCAGERPYTRLFGDKNSMYLFRKWCPKSGMIFTLVMVTTIKKIITVVLLIIQQSFLVISVSRKRWKDKLWVAKSWKRSIKRQNKLYKACLVPTSEQNYKRCKNYEIILPKCFKEAEIRYCDEMFDNHRNYVYNIGKTLKPIINP